MVVPSALGEATASGDAPSETLEPIVAAPPLDSVNAELPIAAVVQKSPSTLSGETNAHFVVAYRAGLPSAHSPNGKGPLLATTVVPPLGTSVPGGGRPSGSPTAGGGKHLPQVQNPALCAPLSYKSEPAAAAAAPVGSLTTTSRANGRAWKQMSGVQVCSAYTMQRRPHTHSCLQSRRAHAPRMHYVYHVPCICHRGRA